MEIILKEDVKGLGYKNDVVKVKPGFGRNYLIPQGLAIVANASNRKLTDENIRQAAHKAEKMKNDALAIAASAEKLSISIPAKTGESGKIFGAITTLQISDALRDKGIDVDRKNISFPTAIKTTGEFVAVLNLHREVSHELKFTVVSEN